MSTVPENDLYAVRRVINGSLCYCISAWYYIRLVYQSLFTFLVCTKAKPTGKFSHPSASCTPFANLAVTWAAEVYWLIPEVPVHHFVQTP